MKIKSIHNSAAGMSVSQIQFTKAEITTIKNMRRKWLATDEQIASYLLVHCPAVKFMNQDAFMRAFTDVMMMVKDLLESPSNKA